MKSNRKFKPGCLLRFFIVFLREILVDLVFNIYSSPFQNNHKLNGFTRNIGLIIVILVTVDCSLNFARDLKSMAAIGFRLINLYVQMSLHSDKI